MSAIRIEADIYDELGRKILSEGAILAAEPNDPALRDAIRAAARKPPGMRATIVLGSHVPPKVRVDC